MTNQNKTYLGDAVYAEFDGYHVILTTEDGISVTNNIALEPQVYQALATYVNQIAVQQLKGDWKLRPENYCHDCHSPLTGDAQYGLCPKCIDAFFEDDEPEEEPTS